MNILYLSQYFHPEQFLNNHIATRLATLGHRVDVVCCVPNYPAGSFFPGYSNRQRKEEEWNGIQVHRVFTVPRGRSAASLILNYLVYPIAASWQMVRLGLGRSDISFVSMPSPLFQALAGIFAKRIWGIPTVYWVQDIWPDSAIITLGIRNRIAVRMLNGLCGWIYRQADRVMVQSDGFHRTIADFGVPPDRIVTLPNCAPPMFAPVESSQIPEELRRLIPENRRTIMFAGNIGESQDFDTIIAAAAMLPPDSDILIVVVGSGRDEARVRDRIRQQDMGARFLFLGRYPERDMPALFACADAMLVSLRDEPIFALTVPSKVQSYMACGRPILASLAGEGSAIIREAGAGIAVPPSSAPALATAMAEIAALDDGELHAMGERGRTMYLERFSLDVVVSQLSSQLGDVLNRRAISLNVPFHPLSDDN